MAHGVSDICDWNRGTLVYVEIGASDGRLMNVLRRRCELMSEHDEDVKQVIGTAPRRSLRRTDCGESLSSSSPPVMSR